MQVLFFIIIMLATFFTMEGITWLTHKYIMHGFLWYLHEDHHKKGPGFFEKNDTFFLIFSIPSILCIFLGTFHDKLWLAALGTGVAMYGFAYFLVHDVIIHQRIKLFTRSNNVYVRSIRWAHKMHHKHLEKYDGESFGMLIAAKKYRDKIKADNKRGVKNKIAATGSVFTDT
ncbi:MAG: beta-carotene hydroxylase [Ginsengibacter sp.]